MVQSILSNLAILLLLHLIMVTFHNSPRPFIKRMLPFITVIIFSISTIAMFYLPIYIGDYYIDLRAIPLITLAYIRGWKPVLPVLIIVSLWRFAMGGDGAIPGIIFGMVGPTLFTLLFHKRRELTANYLQKIVIVTVCWFISDFPIIFIVPDGLETFREIYYVRYGSFLGASFILYSFIVIEKKRQILSEQLEYYATHDTLTQLPNKRIFFEMVEKEMAEHNHQPKYIALIDIDHFKKINDTYGHLFGDEVLTKIATLLKSFTNENLHIARFGGEEFIVFLKNYSKTEVETILNNMRVEISRIPHEVNNDVFYVTVSIGVSELDRHHLIQVIKLADDRLYKAKGNGRNCLVF